MPPQRPVLHPHLSSIRSKNDRRHPRAIQKTLLKSTGSKWRKIAVFDGAKISYSNK
jgi:hypothetical protein